jgi:hypothetical protein
MLKDEPHKSWNRVNITFPTGGWDFNLFLIRDVRHFILYSIFALWPVVVDPHLSSVTMQLKKVPPFSQYRSNKHSHTSVVMILLFCYLFWNQPYTNFIEMKLVVNDFIHTATRLICSWFGTSSAVTLLLFRISLQNCSVPPHASNILILLHQ